MHRVYIESARTIYTPYITVYLMVFLPKLPYIYRIYMVLANSMYIWLWPIVHIEVASPDGYNQAYTHAVVIPYNSPDGYN